MMEEFMKLLAEKAKKQKHPLDESKMKAKASMAKELSDTLGQDLTEGIKDGMKKVTVASNSEHGLEEGLSKAKQILHGKHEEDAGDKESEMEEGEGSMSEKALAEHEKSEPESEMELESEIADLEKQLEELRSKKKHV